MKEHASIVLVVEDEKQIRRFVRTSLEEEGCRVFEASTLAGGLVEAGERKPDLIMLDLGLPDGNGVDFIRDLRGWSDAPILVLSARSNEKDKVQALDAGADDYLTKPFGVADGGPGFSTAEAGTEALFEMFVRGESESALPGVGLGLAICRAIVEAHDGTIAAGNRLQGGACVTFTLPLGKPPLIEEEILPEQEEDAK